MKRLILFLCLCLPLPSYGQTITCTGQAFSFDTPTNPQAQNYTVPSVTNGITIAKIAARNGARDVTAITIGGTNVFSNRIGALVVGTDAVSEAFYRLSTPSGAQSISVTWDGLPISYVLIAVTCGGVNQGTPFNTPSTATGTTGTAVTVNCASASGQLVLDFVSADGNTTMTEGAGQTRVAQGTADATLMSGVSWEAGAAPTVTMSNTLGSSNDWATICASLIPAVTNRAKGEAVHFQ